MNFITAFYFGPICPWISPNLGLFLAPMFRADLTPNRSKLHSYGRTSPKPDRSFGPILPQIGPNCILMEEPRPSQTEVSGGSYPKSVRTSLSGFGRIFRNPPVWNTKHLMLFGKSGRFSEIVHVDTAQTIWFQDLDGFLEIGPIGGQHLWR